MKQDIDYLNVSMHKIY